MTRTVIAICIALAVLVLSGLVAGCSSSKLSKTAASPRTAALIDEAESHLGTAYCAGGATSDCFDCSGFVTSCFASIGITLPRTSREIATVGVAVHRDSVTPGDVVAFRTGGRDINHVGIMVDAQRFIHASTSKGVIVSSLTEKYWRSSYVTARRLVTR